MPRVNRATATAMAPAEGQLTPRATKDRHIWKSGHCSTAGLIETGVINSSQDAPGWHRDCRGSVVNGNGSVLVCSCRCHEGHTVCRDCGEWDVPVTDRSTCTDVEACADRLRAKTRTNEPLRRMIAESREAGAAKRAADRDRRTAQHLRDAERELAAEERRGRDPRSAAVGGPTPVAVSVVSTNGRRPGRVKGNPQPCHCGCGEMTKGGQFAMGHDMKLKGKLFAACRGEGGDAAAAAEVIARGWNAAGILPEVREAAASLLEAEGYDQLVARRVKERYDG